jgi:hypothetical protein
MDIYAVVRQPNNLFLIAEDFNHFVVLDIYVSGRKQG